MNVGLTTSERAVGSVRSSAGFTLLETLIALCVSAIAALGMALLLQQAFAAQGRAEREQHAVLLVGEIVATIAANAAATADYQRAADDPMPSAQVCTASASCDPATLARAQLREWLLRAAAELPVAASGASLTITPTANADSTRRIIVALAWPESDGSQASQISELWLAPA